MNLTIDIGNTRVKAALFLNNRLEQAFYFTGKAQLIQALSGMLPKVHKVIVCTVVDDIGDIISALPAHTLVFKSDTPVPIRNTYQTQSTLGSDRLIAAIGAQALHPGNHCLVVDAGTCIKYNLITKEGEYPGGGISPGLSMRLKAMHHFTDRLPLIDFDENFDTLIGRSTRESILSGALTGAVAEVDGTISLYREQYPGLITVITGGDGGYLAKRLKNHIFAEPYLILQGLNEVLIYNSRFEK